VLELGIPSISSGAKIVEESFRSPSVPSLIVEHKLGRFMTWNIDKGTDLNIPLFNSVLLETGVAREKIKKSVFKLRPSTGELVTELEAKSARRLVRKITRGEETKTDKVSKIVACLKDNFCPEDNYNFARIRSSRELLAKATAAILSDAGFPTVAARGLLVGSEDRRADFVYWVYTKIGDQFEVFSTDSNFAPEQAVFWNYALGAKVTEDQVPRPAINYSIREVVNTSGALSEGGHHSGKRLWRFFSLESSPSYLQGAWEAMLLLPIGALVVTLFRTLIGLPTIGIFMPVLIALALLETGLAWGLALFISITLIGLLARYLLGKLRLLLVPRLAAVLTIVILFVLLLSKFSLEEGFVQGFRITLFPIVIITMVIERLCVSGEESGVLKAAQMALGSLVAALACYFAMGNKLVNYWVLAYPELILLMLALIILTGRYTGFRLSEIYRFRNFENN